MNDNDVMQAAQRLKQYSQRSRQQLEDLAIVGPILDRLASLDQAAAERQKRLDELTAAVGTREAEARKIIEDAKAESARLIAGAEAPRAQILEDVKRAREELEAIQSVVREAQAQRDAAKAEHAALLEKIAKAKARVKEILGGEIAATRKEVDVAKAEHAALQDGIGKATAQIKELLAS